MADPPPGHVRDVEQAVDAAQVDERPVVGDVLDDAHLLHAFREARQRLALELRPLVLQQHPPRKDDVAALSVELDDLHVEGLADELVEIPHRPQIDLGARQKRLEADVDREAALDAGDDLALDDLVVLVRPADLVPYLDAVGLLLREGDEAVVVLALLDEDLHAVSGAEVAPAPRKLEAGHQPLGLVAHVHEHVVAFQADNGSLDDFAVLHPHGGGVQIIHLLRGERVWIRLVREKLGHFLGKVGGVFGRACESLIHLFAQPRFGKKRIAAARGRPPPLPSSARN